MATINKRNGKYCVIYYYVDAKGKKRQKWETFDSISEAKARKSIVEAEKAKGSFIPPNTDTVESFLDTFIELYGYQNWSVSTLTRNRSTIKYYILLYIGKKKLQDIKPIVIEKYYRDLKEQRVIRPMRSNTDGKVTSYILKSVHKLLSCAFGCAEKWELIASNPFKKVTPPKHEYAKKEIESIKTVINVTKEKLNIRLLFQGKIPGILLIGIVIAAFQQWCGLNVVFNYAQEIFAAAGYGVSDILFNIVVTGVTNVIFTFVGMYTVDKLGRRSLMLFGASGLAIIYIIMGICYYLNITGMAVLIMVVLAIACYAMTLAPVTWVVLSQIFPNRIRGMAMAVSTFSLWAACFVLTYTFPLLNSGLGAYGTFWLYGIICILGFVFIKIKLPETKGKSLESIEKELTS